MKTAVIVGGGPAGCQCALWLHMLGYDVMIIEKNNHLGGLQYESPYINNWLVGTINLQGHKIAKNIQRHIEKMNIPVAFNSTIDSIKKTSYGFEITMRTKIIPTHAIVIATGVKANSGSFNISEDVIIGPGKQVHSFAFAKKRIAILGGGDNAAENYSFIKEKNPVCCHIYSRSVRARHNLWKAVDPSDMFLGEYAADQQFMTIEHKGKKQTYDNFVVLYGWEANIPDALSLYKKKLLDDRNFIITDEKRKTNIKNIFAAGEVTHRVHPCVSTAMADGVIVAKAIQEQLENNKINNKFQRKS